MVASQSESAGWSHSLDTQSAPPQPDMGNDLVSSGSCRVWGQLVARISFGSVLRGEGKNAGCVLKVE